MSEGERAVAGGGRVWARWEKVGVRWHRGNVVRSDSDGRPVAVDTACGRRLTVHTRGVLVDYSKPDWGYFCKRCARA